MRPQASARNQYDRREKTRGRGPKSRPSRPQARPAAEKPKKVEEIGGPPGPEPTRYGDWQFNGKVTDF